MTIQEAIQDLNDALTPLYGVGEARSIGRYVFEDFFSIKTQTASQDTIFNNFFLDDYFTLKNRLLAGTPVQYVVGFAWFYGLKFKVNNSVLIPRPETEELVEWILETISDFRFQISDLNTHQAETQNPPESRLQDKTQNSPESLRDETRNLAILDIGTGSGCIPITLKVKNPHLVVSAVDVSESALITASRNAYRHNVDIDFKRIDILNENDWTQLSDYQIIVSNPPYIPNCEKALMSDNVLKHEPHLALFVEDNNALVFYEKIANFALKHLKNGQYTDGTSREYREGGYLFFECNEFNASDVVEMLKNKGFKEVILKKDMSGKDRMVRGKYLNVQHLTSQSPPKYSFYHNHFPQ